MSSVTAMIYIHAALGLAALALGVATLTQLFGAWCASGLTTGSRRGCAEDEHFPARLDATDVRREEATPNGTR
jgi:hypothetical protein